MLKIACAIAVACSLAGTVDVITPDITETRTVKLTQTVVLNDIPAGSKKLRLWVPVPSDNSWQRVLDRKVVSAPGSWRVTRQAEGRGDFVYVELNNPKDKAEVVVDCVVER